jgi:hypothetical protein
MGVMEEGLILLCILLSLMGNCASCVESQMDKKVRAKCDQVCFPRQASASTEFRRPDGKRMASCSCAIDEEPLVKLVVTEAP